jgi:hypothetical protein
MGNLSATATIILNYAKGHSTEDGYVDLQNYTALPENQVINACKELLKHGLISDIEYSADSVEYILLKLK